MKAHKFHEAMRRHPYLRSLLKWGYGMTYEPQPRHIHFIAVRPPSRVPHGSFSTRRDEYGEGPRDVWTESEEWTVIFRIREDVGRCDPMRYCALPFTEINLGGKRDFQQSGEWDRAHDYGYTPDTDILEFKELWERHYREMGHVTPEFVALVQVKRSWGLLHMSHTPARITIYQ